MAHFRHFLALLWKNWLIKKRNWVSSIFEILLPILFTLIMIAIYNQFDTNFAVDSQFTDPLSIKKVYPLHSVPYRLLLQNSRLGVVAGNPSLSPYVDQLIQDFDNRYPALNGSTVGGQGFVSSALRDLYLPKFSDALMKFTSEKELEDYIKTKDYALNPDKPTIWGSIVLYSGPPHWDYAIRMNGSAVYNTRLPKVDLLQRGYDENSLRRYQFFVPASAGNPFARRSATYNPVLDIVFPGYLSLQLAIDRWIINQTVPLSMIDTTSLTTTVSELFSFIMVPSQAKLVLQDFALLNVTNPSRLQAILAHFHSYIGNAERYVPQQVDIVPFPYTSYQSNNFYSTVTGILPLFFVLSMLFPVSRLVRGIVMEKEMKLREGMRMMGLTEASLFGSWLTMYTILYLVLAIIITIMTRNNIFKYSQPGVIGLTFFLFGLSSTMYCYLISVFFSRAKTASTVGIVLFLGGYFPFFAVQPNDISQGAKLFSSLLSPTAFSLGIDLICSFEDNGAGANDGNLNSVVNNWSVGGSFGMMILDTILYGLLAWYCDNVLPAKYREFGIPRPYNFPFTVSYWREVLNLPPLNISEKPSAPLLNAATSSSSSSSSKPATRSWWFPCGRKAKAAPQPTATIAPADASYFEDPDSSLRAKETAGSVVAIRKLRKEFDTPDGIKVAVNDIDMTMYEGQIFVLLGHNGAGKTTTISMLTGLIEPTNGEMLAYGHDVRRDLAEVRKQLGVCPQHDVLWPELTVEEHLRIFAEIKEVPKDRINAEITKALQDVGLTEKLKYRTSTLSGGQKRKLSVCIALVGGSKVIFLDEPTSGMDPYSRRSTWQILQNAREGRVMVLTTHFMDEADLLGDRIGIMANGTVRCVGSPLFLKQRFGVGYILTVVKAPGCHSDAIIDIVRRYVPEMTVGTNVGAELSLRLPLSSSPAFPALFTELDSRLKELKIVTYGISASDIQDVFLKIAGGDHLQQHDQEIKNANQDSGNDNSGVKASASSVALDVQGHLSSSSSSSTDSTVIQNAMHGSTKKSGLDAVRAEARIVQTGWRTFVRHFYALFLKRWNGTRRDTKSLCYQLLIPVIMTLGGLALLRSGIPNDYPDYQLSTAQLNAGGRRVGDPNKPVHPNYVPYMNFKSTDTSMAVASTDITNLMNSFQTPNATTNEARLIFSPADVLAFDSNDPYNFITSNQYPTRDWQRMSSFLLRDKHSYAASKFGAFVWTKNRTLVASQDLTAIVPTAPVATYSIFVNTTAKHGSAIFMNLAHTAMYRQVTGDTTASITTRNHPLPFTIRQSNLIGAFFSFSAATIIVLAYAFIPASYAIWVVKEREVSAKHQQLISGVSVSAFWTANYVFDSITYIFPAGVSILLCKLFDIKEFTDTTQNRAGALVLLFWLYGLSVAPFTYILSYLFKSHSTAQNTVLFINVTCMILMIASLIMGQIESTCRADEWLRYIYRLLPGYSLGNGLISLSFLSQLSFLDASCDRAHGIIRPASAYFEYDAFDMKATGTNLIFMACEAVVYFIITILIDIGLSHPRLRLYFQRDPVVPLQPIMEDEDVVREQHRVAEEVKQLTAAGILNASTSVATPTLNNLVRRLSTIMNTNNVIAATQSNDTNTTGTVPTAVTVTGTATDSFTQANPHHHNDADVVIVNNLRKVYAGPTGGKVAVRGLSYGIPSGEVFGFLGINGAGKTTTLQMLSGDVLPSSGGAFLGGYDIISQQPQVRRLLGYCPQHEALIELLTVREHLELYARIKGVPEKDLPAVVSSQIEQFDLGQFANKVAGSLSGGNKRKLSVAVALIGNPPIVFLDEPSTGMDPVAKRFMWSVISRVATERKQCSIILTTHSMEEVEALCTRIGIMVGGRLRCLGSSQHLKHRHGNGYVAEIKLAPPSLEHIHMVENSIRTAMEWTIQNAFVTRRNVQDICQRMNNGARYNEITEAGSGWIIDNAFKSSILPSPIAPPDEKVIPLNELAVWWAEEDLVANLLYHIGTVTFPGATVTERHGTKITFRVPPQSHRLSELFTRLEQARSLCNMQGYAFSQTSLEQIFNHFAADQDEEKGIARGMLIENERAIPRQTGDLTPSPTADPAV